MASRILRRERKSGTRWVVRFPTGELNERGKPKHDCKTFRYLREAKDHLKTLEDARTAGKPITESEQPLSAFLAEHLEGTDLRESSRTNYKEVIGLYIKPTLGKTALRDITPMKVQRLYTTLRKTLAPRTVRLTHSILHTALDHAVTLKLIRSNPSTGLKLPKKTDVPINYLRGEELSAFLTAVQEDMYGALFEFLLASGCRPGEGRGLMWSDIDFKKGTVFLQRSVSDAKPWTFNAPKTAKGKRTIGLPEQTLKMLQAHQTEQEEQNQRRQDDGEEWEDGGLVFCDSKGRPLDRRNLANKHLKPLLKRVAEGLYPAKGEPYERLCGCNLYSLRHTFATTLIEHGVNLKTVSETLGHKDVSTTIEVYVHSTPTMAEEAVKQISKALYS